MKFFVPEAKTEKEAQEVIQGIRKFVKELGWATNEKKFYSISYTHDGKQYLAEVGKPHPLTKELVVAILESNTFLICTPNRSVIRGDPILVGKNDTFSVKEFE